MLTALDSYLEHPYLELDPDFERIFLSDADREELAEMLGTSEHAPHSPRSSVTLGQQQEHLSELMSRAVEGFQRHPLMRWGLTPANVKPLTVITHMFLHVGWFHFLGNLLILFLAELPPSRLRLST